MRVLFVSTLCQNAQLKHTQGVPLEYHELTIRFTVWTNDSLDARTPMCFVIHKHTDQDKSIKSLHQVPQALFADYYSWGRPYYGHHPILLAQSLSAIPATEQCCQWSFCLGHSVNCPTKYGQNQIAAEKGLNGGGRNLVVISQMFVTQPKQDIIYGWHQETARATAKHLHWVITTYSLDLQLRYINPWFYPRNIMCSEMEIVEDRTWDVGDML